MTGLAAVLLSELDDEALSMLGHRLAPIIASRIHQSEQSAAWLDAQEAAKYIACPRSRIYALVRTKLIPRHRDGSRLLFRREELDDWVRAGGAHGGVI